MHGTFEPSLTPPRPQAVKLRDIERKYAAHRRDQKQRRVNPTTRMAWLRLSEMERLFAHRYGRTLPDDDAGRGDLFLAMQHIAGAGVDVMHRCIAWARLWAPWMPTEEARALAAQTMAKPLRFKAATLGARLGLTEAERASLRLKTIRSIDGEDTEQRRKRLDRERKAAKRAEARAAKPEPLSHSKPWREEGISRATWYRLRP